MLHILQWNLLKNTSQVSVLNIHLNNRHLRFSLSDPVICFNCLNARLLFEHFEHVGHMISQTIGKSDIWDQYQDAGLKTGPLGLRAIFYHLNTSCCVFRPANTCLRMCSHGRKLSKSFKNWKKYFFTHFWMILIVFNHANTCASMRLLVEIHNN